VYELIILSLLMRFSLHGYLIAKIANDIIGPWAKISNGTLYPLLTRLEQAGLIAQTSEQQDREQRERHARVFMITDEGRKRFYQLMMDTSSNIGDYQRIFHLKAGYLDLLQPRECLYVLNHYINYCQASILYMKSESEDLVHEIEDSPHRELSLLVMQHHAEMWQAEVDWTMRLREKLVSLVENGKSSELQLHEKGS